MTTTTETAPTETEGHWLTKYDPDDGEPYGEGCHCEIGVDHDGNGEPNGPDTEPDEANEMPAATTEPQPLTLTEFLAEQLRSKHILDGRWVQMSATVDGTRINIDIEHPFPPVRHIRVVAHLEVLAPDELDAAEHHAEQDGVEIGASA